MHCLHIVQLLHMDVTSSNIMLRNDGYKAWDQLRLLDFGFAQLCGAGKHALCLALVSISPGEISPVSPASSTNHSVRRIVQAMPSALLACLSADPMVPDVRPEGATPAYAPPEVLRSLQQQYVVAEWDDALVNGPSADWWSVGVVLFSLLTGELPFSDEGPTTREAPVSLPSHCRAQWQDSPRVLEEQQIWVSICSDSSDGRFVMHTP